MIGDTILALASAPGLAERAVLRLSGPRARAAAALVFAPEPSPVRAQQEGTIGVLGHRLPALLLSMPGPRSYTGEDVVELHLPGSPMLLAMLQDELLDRGEAMGVRAALPGEFTRRAFQNGRLDLTEAEGVLALIHAGSEQERLRALGLLQGGVRERVARSRAGLQDALAALEAGLDFTDGETGAVDTAEWLPIVTAERRALAELAQGLPQARRGGEVLLLGAANAGKSSLCNALCGRQAVLVDAAPGTTRDVLRVEVGEGLCLWDAPGDLADPAAWDRAALELRDLVAADAAAALIVLDPGAVHVPATALPVLAVVSTRADQGGVLALSPLPGVPLFAVDSVTGTGVAALRTFLQGHAGAGARDLGGPQRQALTAAVAALDRALATAASGGGGEVVALDVQGALVALGRIDGSHSPEDLLDRIFRRFCLGK